MVVSHFGVRAVVDKGGETCDQGGVCRQSDGKHVTRAVFSQRVCLVAIVSSAKFEQFRMRLCMLRGILLHLSLQTGLVGRVVAVAVIVVKHC